MLLTSIDLRKLAGVTGLEPAASCVKNGVVLKNADFTTIRFLIIVLILSSLSSDYAQRNEKNYQPLNNP